MNDPTRILFDAPGPRGRRRIRLLTVVALLALGALATLALQVFAAHGQLDAQKWAPFGQWPILRYLLGGLQATVQATIVCAVLAFPLGMLIALGRLARHRWLSWPCAVYTEIFRSLPVLLLIYLFLLVLPRYGLTLPVFWQLVVPIVISASSTTAEIFRAGVLSLERGQTEAAMSLGLSYGQVMRLVVIPQVVRRLLPALVNQLVSLLKDTTLGYVVSFSELLNSGRALGEYTHDLLQTYLVVALIFALANGTLSQLASAMERRQRRRSSTAGPSQPGIERTAALTIAGAT